MIGTRAAAAELARLLDAAAAGTPVAVASLPAGASGSPAQLAGVALRLQSAAPALAATAVPRPDFRAALRQRLVAVASVQAAAPAPARSAVRSAALEAAVSWSQGVRARRGVGVAVGAMASVVVVAGIGTAGARSLPGDPFYGVKTAGEAVELRAADGAVERGTTHLRHASRRLDEVARLTRGRDAVVALPLTGSGRPVAGAVSSDLVVDTLEAMDEATLDGSRLLVRAAEDDPALLEQLTTFSARQDRALSALVPELPLAAQDRAQESLALVAGVGGDALALLLADLPAPAASTSGLPEPAVDLPAVPSAPPAATPDDAVPAPSGPLAPSPAPAPSPAAPGTQPEPVAEPAPAPRPTASPSPQPAPAPEVPLPVPSLPVPLPVPAPTSVPLPEPVPEPALPLPVPVPPVLPSLPPVPAVPAVPGLLVEAPRTVVDTAP